MLVKEYGLDREIENRYKPAKLIHVTLEHVFSKDSFLTLFFTFLHENLTGATSDITLALSYFEDISSWEPTARNDVMSALEKFAQYMVTQFFLPRAFNLPPTCDCFLTQAIQLEHHPSRHRSRHPPHYPRYKRRPLLAQNSAYLS